MSFRLSLLATPRVVSCESVAAIAGAVALVGGPSHAPAQCLPSWNQITTSPSPPPAPAARGYSGIAFDPSASRVLVYGGGTNSAGFRDLWQWNGTAWSNLGIGAPGTRKAPAMTWDAARARVVLFGGAFTTANDTWEWNGSWTQVATIGPPLRGFTSMVYDAARAKSVLFGGWSNGFNYFNDTWEWDGATWNQVSLAGPLPHTRGFHAMAYDAARQRVVLFGGLWNDASSSNYLGDTWEFDGSSWTQLATASSPPARAYHAMEYDPIGQRIVMHGGFEIVHGAFNDTWSFQGGDWVLLSPGGTTPISRQAFAMTYDSTRSKFMVFGGVLGSTFRNDLWSLELPTCCVADVDDGTGSGTPDGGVTIDDLLFYLSIFEAGDIRSDVDNGTSTGTPDGGVTIDDLLYYLQRFESGC